MIFGGERRGGHGAELVFRQQGGALIVEAPAIGFHVVEPDLIRPAGVGFGEQQDGRRHTRIRLERAAGQRDDGIELLILHQHLPQRPVGIGGAEENPIRHDDRRTTARLEQAEKQGQEEQFGLLGLDDRQQILGGVFVIERTGEGRIGQHEGVFFILTRVILGEGIVVGDVGVFHTVQEHVHAADAEHGVVEIKPVE